MSYNKYLSLWRKEVSLCAVFHLLGKNIEIKGYLFIGSHCLLILKRKTTSCQEVVMRQSQVCRSAVEDWGDDNSGCVSGNSTQTQPCPHHENMDTLLSTVLVYGHTSLLSVWSWEGHICSEPLILHMQNDNWSSDLMWLFTYNSCNYYLLKPWVYFWSWDGEYITVSKWKSLELRKCLKYILKNASVAHVV